MMQSAQDTFGKMNMDLNPSKINKDQGVFLKGRNGSVISNGGNNNFKWTSDTGTEHIFTLPYRTMVSTPKQYAKANLYYFDGRSAGYNIEYPSSTRAFICDIKKNGVKQGQIYAEVTHNVTAGSYAYKISVTLGGFNAYEVDGVTTPIPSNWCIEHVLLNEIVTLLNTVPTINRGGLKWTLKRHNVITPTTEEDNQLRVELPEFSDFTWYIEFIYEEDNANIGLLCRETNEGDTVFGMGITLVHNNSRNKLGWGRGSVNGSPIQFPCSAPFPTPGLDPNYEDSEPMPMGRAIEIKQNQWYFAYDGDGYRTHILQKNPLVTDTAFNSPTYLNSFTKGNFFYVEQPNVESAYSDGAIIEVNPRSYAYSILKNQFIAAVEIPAQDIEVVYVVKISVNKILLFCVTGQDDERLIYTVDFTNKVPVATLILATTENIDFGINNPIRCCHVRYESDEYYYVYWCAKTGFLREINLSETITKDYDFNTRVHKPVNFGKIHTSNVYRSGGTLLAGGYQFAYSLSIDGVNYTKCSSHTNAVHIGSAKGYSEEINETNETIGRPQPVPQSLSRYKGAEPGTKTTNSIEVKITNIDRRYRYIKIYAIEAISGSGQYGSAVVNEIHAGELSNSDYFEFVKVYTGINDVIRGGLNISEVTLPTIVPVNIKNFFFNNNRLIISGYDEYSKQLTETERLNVLGGIQGFYISEPVGSDRAVPRVDIKAKNNGYKNIINQQFKKSLGNTIYEFAWVFEDEYGNNTEPMKITKWGGRQSFNDAEQHFFLFAPVDSNERLLYNPGGSQIDYYRTGYIANAQGVAISQSYGSFPTWAKKAKLVRRSQDFAKADVIYFVGRRWSPLTDTLMILSAWDIDGFNSFKRVGVSEGDSIVITHNCNNAALTRIMESLDAGAPVKETTYAFFQNGTTAGLNRTTLSILYATIKRVSDTEVSNPTATAAFPTSYDTKVTGLTLLLDQTIPQDGLVFGYIQKRKNSDDANDVVYFEETGCEIDLTVKRTDKRINFFPGDHFIGGLNKPIMYKKNEPENRLEISTLYVPYISRYNFSMAPTGWFIEQDDSNAKKEMLTINRDYGVTNPWLKHLYISDDYLKERTKFRNTVIYSNQREPNTKYNPFGQLKANNVVDLFAKHGEITAIEEYGDIIYVFYERGIKQLFPSEKEFLETSSGTRIAVGDGSYLITKDNDFSDTKGTTYPILKTDKGIYFYDVHTNTLNRINKGMQDLSLDGQCKTFFQRFTSEETNTSEWRGVFLTYDNVEERVIITLSGKEKSATTAKIISTTQIGFLIQKDSFFVGDAVTIETTGYVAFGTITAIQNEGSSKLAVVTHLASNYLVKNYLQVGGTGVFRSATITKSKYELETIVYNEKTEAFEKLTDKVLIAGAAASDKYIAIDPITHQNLHLYEVEDETNIVAFQTSGVSFNPRYRFAKDSWNTIFESVTQYTNQDSVGISTPVRKIKFTGTNAPSANYKMLSCTKKQFLFLKGYKYVISGSILYTNAGSTAGTDIAKLFIPKEFYSFVSIDSQTNNALSNGTNLTLNVSVEFTVLSTFESPLVISFEKLSGTLTSLELTLTEFSKQVTLVPELTVVMNGPGYREEIPNISSAKYVYDNGNVTIDKENNTDLEVTVLGSETAFPSTTGVGSIKKRLQEFRYSVPYSIDLSGDKQRQRGVYHVIKYKFVNYVRKFSVNSVKHFFRKSS